MCVCACVCAAMPTAAGLFFGAANTSGCPPGFSKIVLAPACASAAVAVGWTYDGTATHPAQPSGCILSTGVPSDVYFNADPTDAPNPISQPLCAGAAAKPRASP